MSKPAMDFAAARRVMVLSQLRPQGVTDTRILSAMGRVAREEFLPDHLAASAYSDRPLRLAGGAPVMPPAELGQLLNQLVPKPGERALVIGEGGAYSAAVLRELGLAVDTADTIDTTAGAYDIVLVEGAVEQVPPTLGQRLVPGGRVAAAIVEDGVTRLAIGRAAGASVSFISFAEAQVPLLSGFARIPAFTF
jgi:protein-L-isoaspartate(D-aspartate) O-methyltransferase